MKKLITKSFKETLQEQFMKVLSLIDLSAEEGWYSDMCREVWNEPEKADRADVRWQELQDGIYEGFCNIAEMLGVPKPEQFDHYSVRTLVEHIMGSSIGDEVEYGDEELDDSKKEVTA